MRIAALAVVVGGASVTGEPMGCSDLPTQQDIEVTWSIPDGPGPSGVQLIGCHDWGADVDHDGASFDPGWQRCAVQGWRQDGQLRVTSTPVKIASDADSIHVEFDLPSGPIGGMGAEVRSTGASVRIERVLPGTPAARAGLQAGDRVLAVDGNPTEYMSTDRFVRVVTGAPGSSVGLKVTSRSGEEIRDVHLIRQRIRSR